MPYFFSFIIPVFNRPEEVRELLESFENMETRDLNYDIVIVEDGSQYKCDAIVEGFKKNLPVTYYYKENSGPGESRNYGMKKAKGNYFIILDSDVLLPRHYLKAVNDFLHRNKVDCFGGADAVHDSFTPIQKAISYAMTSFLTTGGIRGKTKTVEKFKPRSFNMGLSKAAFDKTGGFSKMRVGEDLDLSLRLSREGYKTAFIADAFVYHKRRVSWRAFSKQVFNFGIGRPVLDKRFHRFSPFSVLPALFVIGLVLALILILFGIRFLFEIYIVYFLLIFVESLFQYKSFKIGIYSVWATILQFLSYGSGYLQATYQIIICKRKPEDAFPHLFFKE